MDIRQELKTISKPRNIRGIVFGLCIVISALLIFQAGMYVGYRKASFSYGLGDNYYRTLGGPHSEGVPGFLGDDMPGGHGVVGKIIKISLPTLVVASPDNLEKVIVVNADTLVRRYRDTITADNLQVDDSVIVLGSPDNQGQVIAKLIRVIPAATSTPTSSDGASTTSSL